MPPITQLLIFANCAVYILMAWCGHTLSFSPQYAVSWGADYAPLTESGQWWRLISCMFIHFTPMHLISNMICLLIWGSFTERFLGTGRELIGYFLSGLSASLASVLLNPPHMVSAGASGAISGLLGIMLAMKMRHCPQVSWSDLLVNIGLNVGLTLVFPVDWVAHVAGLVCGTLYGLMVLRPLSSR